MSHGYQSPQSMTEKRQDPKCSLCVNHMGKKEAPRTLGHKGLCQYANCICEKCRITLKRRKGTAIEQQQRRNPEKRPKMEDNDPEPIIDAVKPKLEELIRKIYAYQHNQKDVIQKLEGFLDTYIETLSKNDENMQPIVQQNQEVISNNMQMIVQDQPQIQDQQQIQELSESDEEAQAIIPSYSLNYQYVQSIQNPSYIIQQETENLITNADNFQMMTVQQQCYNFDYDLETFLIQHNDQASIF